LEFYGFGLLSFKLKIKKSENLKIMRIGIDIRNVGKQRTGDEAVFFNLVKNLAGIDDKNEYLLFTDIIDTTVLQYIVEKLGIKNKSNFKIISLKSPNKFCWNLCVLPSYLRKNPVDVYHTQYIIPFFVCKKTKIVTHIHDVSFLAYPEFIKKSDLFFLKLLIPRSLKRADKIIAVSKFTKDEIIKYYKTDPEKIEVVYNSVSEDFSKSDYSGNELFEIKKKYNLPEKFVLYIGTMQPRKNIPFLIDGFAKTKEKISNIKLVLAGNKKAHNFDNKIDEKIKKLNLASDVIFSGFVDEKDKAALFQLAEVFVYPSLYEGFGIPILEAMSQKIPVLASNISVHRETGGEVALYFDIDKIDDFSEKLYNLSTDKILRDKLIGSSFERINIFSWKKSAENILIIYQKING